MSRIKKEILSKLKEYANKMGRDHLGGDDYTSNRKGGLRDNDGYDNVDYNKDMPMDEDSPESSHPQGSKKLTNRTTVMDMLDVISHKEFGPDYHKLSTKQKKEVHKLAIKGKLIKQSPFKESVNEILVIVDKFDKRKQDYDKVYYQDGGKRPGDGDINKAQKEFAKLSKKHKGLTLISVGRNSKMYDVNESIEESMFSAIDQIRQDSKDVRDFVKNVFKDREFKKMSTDKEFIKYLKSIYEGINEAIPQNFHQGRTSDYHTALRGKNKDYSGGTNFKKKNHGQPDVEEDDEDQETNHLSNTQTHVKSDKLKVSEYGQRLDLSFIEDEEAKLDGTYPSTDAIDRDIDETAKRDYKDEYKKFQSSKKSKKYRAELNKYNRQKGTYGNGDGKDASHKGGKIVGFESESKNRGRAEKSRLKKESVVNEIGQFPINNYIQGIIPQGRLDTNTAEAKRKSAKLVKDLRSTLNNFWKSHDIPYRIK